MDSTLNLSGDLFVINTGDKQHIPAMEMDISTGEYSILIFTSYENAQKYCYLKNPDGEGSIKVLSKQRFGSNIIQSGLLRIARAAEKRHNITSFVFDHPGIRGIAQYAAIKDVLHLGRIKKNEDPRNELTRFLDDEV